MHAPQITVRCAQFTNRQCWDFHRAAPLCFSQWYLHQIIDSVDTDTIQ